MTKPVEVKVDNFSAGIFLDFAGISTCLENSEPRYYLIDGLMYRFLLNETTKSVFVQQVYEVGYK